MCESPSPLKQSKSIGSSSSGRSSTFQCYSSDDFNRPLQLVFVSFSPDSVFNCFLFVLCKSISKQNLVHHSSFLLCTVIFPQ